MSENQKLREVLLSDMDIAVLRMPVNMAFAGNMAQFQYHNRVQALLNRIEALAMQPDVPETNFGKLREALQAISHIDDTTNHSVDASAALDRIGQIARQALALPTAAPEMPLSMNQFGRLVELTREHLSDNTFVYKATSKTGDTCHFGVESAAKAWAKGGTVEAIKVREFKLHTGAPTADHLPDAGNMVVDHFPDATKMIETAAPVGEREVSND